MRKANINKPLPPGVTLSFRPHEIRFLRKNLPGESGQMGGYQQMENWLLENTNATGDIWLDPQRLERLIRYCQRYGSGGPNGRIRDACIPALRRAGIELLPDWQTP